MKRETKTKWKHIWRFLSCTYSSFLLFACTRTHAHLAFWPFSIKHVFFFFISPFVCGAYEKAHARFYFFQIEMKECQSVERVHKEKWKRKLSYLFDKIVLSFCFRCISNVWYEPKEEEEAETQKWLVVIMRWTAKAFALM